MLYKKLVEYLEHKNALIITGMRQVGKTTLMKQVFETVKKPKLWFDFDNPFDLLHFENIDYDAIYYKLVTEANSKDKRLFIFIDEIQNYPEITKIIKYHIDKYSVKYVVSGSSNYYLKNLFPESLSGRKFLFVLNPLSFSEFLYFKNKTEEPVYNENIQNLLKDYNLLEYKKNELEYNEYMEYGGFPEVVTTENTETKKMILKNIFTSFFEKDIKIILDLKDIRELRDLILLLIPRIGNILDVMKLSNDLGLNRVKIYSYLDLLQGVFFLRLIPKYSKSIDRTVAGGRKVYFSDTGLLNTIGRVNDGQLLENTISNQLINYGEVSFYNKRNKAEIDFILDKTYAFEVKNTVHPKDLIKLEKNVKEIGIDKFYMISKAFVEIKNTIFPQMI
ncbi:MAG: ATP-binding protein [Ignavibacteriae bacterium]|nr:ATP-binding protein [Ignavibacteriota bacterium]